MEINGTMSFLTNGQIASSNDTSKAPSNLFQGLLLNATSLENASADFNKVVVLQTPDISQKQSLPVVSSNSNQGDSKIDQSTIAKTELVDALEDLLVKNGQVVGETFNQQNDSSVVDINHQAKVKNGTAAVNELNSSKSITDNDSSLNQVSNEAKLTEILNAVVRKSTGDAKTTLNLIRSVPSKLSLPTSNSEIGPSIENKVEDQPVSSIATGSADLAKFLETLKNEPEQDQSLQSSVPVDNATLLQMISMLFSQPDGTKEVWSTLQERISSLNDKDVIQRVLSVLRTVVDAEGSNKPLSVLPQDIQALMNENASMLSIDQKREIKAIYSIVHMIDATDTVQQTLGKLMRESLNQSQGAESAQQGQNSLKGSVLKEIYPKNSSFKTWEEQLLNVERILEKKLMPNNAMNSTQVLQNKLSSKPFRMPIVATNVLPSEAKQEANEAPIIQGDMNKVQQFVLHVGTNNSKGEGSTGEFVKNFEAILAKSSFTTNGPSSRLLIKLNPEHLGNLQIELVKQNDQLIARIMTSTSEAKELIESQLQALKQTFQHQHLAVDKLEVQQQFQPFTSDPAFKEGQNPSQQEEKRQQSEHQQEEESALEEFGSTFQEALLNTKV